MTDKKKTLRTLFLSTFYLSSFTFGGGYVIVPLMKKKFVEDLKWIEEKEMLDLVAIAQSSPGGIAVNTSIILGYKVAGLMGTLVAILGTVLPPLIIISVISMFYKAFRDNRVINVLLLGMQAGVAAVIVDVVLGMAQSVLKEKSRIAIVVMVSAFVATYFFKVNIMLIILTGALMGILSVSKVKKVETGRDAA